MRKNTGLPKTSNVDKGQNQYMLGKTKKFYFERYAGIIDYLLSIDAADSTEVKNIGHSLDYHACVSCV